MGSHRRCRRERPEVGVQGADARTAGDRHRQAGRRPALARRMAGAADAGRRVRRAVATRCASARRASSCGASRASTMFPTGCARSRCRCCRSFARITIRRCRSSSGLDLTGPKQNSKQVGKASPTSRAATTRSSTPSTTIRGSRATLASSTAPTSASQVIDHVRSSRKTKRSASGKIKTQAQEQEEDRARRSRSRSRRATTRPRAAPGPGLRRPQGVGQAGRGPHRRSGSTGSCSPTASTRGRASSCCSS